MYLTVFCNSVRCVGMNTELTIQELAARVAVEIGAMEQHSGRVSEVPSERTIRYYMQLGITDKPLFFKGRTAYFGERHVQQLLAVKKLQTHGLSLSEIQERMLGISDSELAKLSDRVLDDGSPTNPKGAGSSRAFWEEAPAESSPKDLDVPSTPAVGVASDELAAVRLDESSVLILEGLLRDLHGDDLDAIRVAAAPLLKLLRVRNLLGTPQNRRNQ